MTARFEWCHPDPESESFIQQGPDGRQWFGVENEQGVIRCLEPVKVER